MSSKPLDLKQRRPDDRTRFIETGKEVLTGRHQMLSTGNIGDKDAVVDQALWCFILKVPMNHCCRLVLHSLRNIEPVQFVMQ